METALARQPRVGPAAPRGGRTLRIALGLGAATLVTGAVLLQPFGTAHLFPGRTPSPSTASNPTAAAPASLQAPRVAAAGSAGDPPAAAQLASARLQPAPAPARPAPVGGLPLPAAANLSPRSTTTAAKASGVLLSPLAVPGGMARGMAVGGVTAAPPPPAAPTAVSPETILSAIQSMRQPAAAPSAPAAQKPDRRTVPTAAAGSPIRSTELPAAARSAPLPREPLPLNTDLLPEASNPKEAAPSAQSSGGNAPVATDRHG